MVISNGKNEFIKDNTKYIKFFIGFKMKKRVYRSLLLFSLSFILPFFSTAMAFTIKLCYPDNESPPWQFGHGDVVSDPPGLSIEVIQKAAKELGITVIYSRLPTNPIFYSIKKNEVDGIFTFSHLPEREEFGIYPMKEGKVDQERRVASMTYSFYKLKNSDVSWDGKKLSNLVLNVGVNRGYSIIDKLKKLNIPYEESKGNENLLNKLEKLRVSSIIGHTISIDYYIAKLKLKNVVKLKPTVMTNDYYVIFSHKFYKENKKVSEKFWDKIAEVREAVLDQKIKDYSK
jgi:polar amino acid transport system substrate-binding protein